MIVFANPQFERMFGYEPGELLGKHVSIVNDPGVSDPQETASSVMAELARTGRWSGEVQNIRKDGETFYCSASVSAFDHPKFGKSWVSVHKDITAIKKLADALRESESLFRAVFDNAAIGIAQVSVTGQLLRINREFCRIIGYASEEIEGQGFTFQQITLPEDLAVDMANVNRLLNGVDNSYAMEKRYLRKDGATLWVSLSVYLLRNAAEEPLFFISAVQDISDRNKAREALESAHEFTRSLIHSMLDGFSVLDINGCALDANPALCRMTGFSREELLGLCAPHPYWPPEEYENINAAFQRTPAGEADNLELIFMRKNGERFPVIVSPSSVRDQHGDIISYIATVKDISRRKRAEEYIRKMAFHDTLTQLPNRRLLSDRLEQTSAASKRSGCYGALMFLDLDNFKPLNDTHRHDAGDLLLMEVAHRLTSCVREMDTVARFGGDEFMVMLSELDVNEAESVSQASGVAEKIRAALAKPYVLRLKRDNDTETTIEHRCATSIGVVLFINHESSTEEIIKWADMAMYQAKEAGGNQIRFHDRRLE